MRTRIANSATNIPGNRARLVRVCFVLTLLATSTTLAVITQQETPDESWAPLKTQYISLHHMDVIRFKQLIYSSNTPANIEQLVGQLIRDYGRTIDESRLRTLLTRNIDLVTAGELTVTADVGHSALLIRASAGHLRTVLELIKLVDVPQRQLVINVTIAQLTISHSENIEPSSGVRYQLISDNMDILMQSLRASGNLEVFTRPTIMTRDNTPGNVSYQRKIPIPPKPDEPADSVIKYKHVLTSLSITPRIDPDGYVSLDINITNEDIVADVFTIPPAASTRTAHIELRLREGQAVCLVGFTSDVLSFDEKKLGLFGGLFKAIEPEPAISELIILITPRIISPISTVEYPSR